MESKDTNKRDNRGSQMNERKRWKVMGIQLLNAADN